MLKPTIFSILLAAGTFTASAKYVTKISGTVDISLGTDTVMVIEDSAHPFFDRKWIIPVTDGKFSQEIETDHPMACYFIPMNQIRWWSYNWRFIADGGDVNVTATKMGDEPTAVLDFSGPLSVKLRDFANSLYESKRSLCNRLPTPYMPSTASTSLNTGNFISRPKMNRTAKKSSG